VIFDQDDIIQYGVFNVQPKTNG